ncbi:hypothetical protein EV1_042882 [Malus domestica]
MSNFSILEAKSPPPTATAAQFVVVQYSSKIPLSLFALSDSQWSLQYRLRNWQVKAASLAQCETFIVILERFYRDTCMIFVVLLLPL